LRRLLQSRSQPHTAKNETEGRKVIREESERVGWREREREIQGERKRERERELAGEETEAGGRREGGGEILPSTSDESHVLVLQKALVGPIQ
jgi:hypothetical protein